MKTRKIVINSCFGGFGLSPRALENYAQRKGKQVYWYATKDRNDFRGNCVKIGTPENDLRTAYSLQEDLGEECTNDELNKATWFHDRDIPRDDKDLVAVVKEMGVEASGRCAKLKIVSIPSDVVREIDEYDGSETIHEVHRSWG